MSKKNKPIKGASDVDVNISDVESALNSENNEFGDIQVDILEENENKVEENSKEVDTESAKSEHAANIIQEGIFFYFFMEIY